MAPAFIQRPVDTTVTDGMTAVLQCEVSGAPKPAIAWKRGRWLPLRSLGPAHRVNVVANGYVLLFLLSFVLLTKIQ